MDIMNSTQLKSYNFSRGKAPLAKLQGGLCPLVPTPMLHGKAIQLIAAITCTKHMYQHTLLYIIGPNIYFSIKYSFPHN